MSADNEEIEKIIVKIQAAMAPKEKQNSNKTENPNEENVVESDLEEIVAVNDSLDELSSALDTLEEKTENIMAKLQELLNSNKEIRQSMANENLK